MRHRRQGEKGIATRRVTGFGDRRAVDRQAHILSQTPGLEDVADMGPVARADQNGVVARILPQAPGAPGAEIPDEQPHRPPRPGQLLRRPAMARLVTHQAVTGMARVGI